MTQVSRATWAASLASLLADNSSGDISAADMRSVLNDLEDSCTWYDEVATHTHAASAITSGTLTNARVAEGNVTQHEGAIDALALTNAPAEAGATADQDATEIAAMSQDWRGQGSETLITATAALEAAASAGISDGDKGDITVASSGSVWTVDDEAITLAKMQHIATDSFLGRDTTGTGDVEVLSATAARGILNVEDGADVTDATNVQAAGALMDSELADEAAVKALTALADPTAYALVYFDTVTGEVEYWDTITDIPDRTAFTSGDKMVIFEAGVGLRIVDYDDLPSGAGVSDGDKGDITVSSSGAVWTIDNNAVTNNKIRDCAAFSLIGRSANTAGNPADIEAGTDHQVMRRSGTTIGFGSINLAQADATTGSLPVDRGGTGAATHSSGNVLVGAGTGAVTSTKVAPAGAFVGTTDTQTLTNKTLTAPDISDPTIAHEYNAQTGTSYTLVAADQSAIITMSNAAANTLTIPANATVAFPIGTLVQVWALGAGTTTIAGATGVTLQGNGGSVSAGSCDIQTQYGGATLTKIATDTWMVGGDIDAVA